MIATSSIRPRCRTKRQHGGHQRERADLPVESPRSNAYQRSGPARISITLREQHVQREPDGEVEDHADHRRGDRGERARQALVGAQLLDERRAGEDQQHRRHEGDPGGERRAEHRAGRPARTAPGSRQAPRKPTNCVTLISGPGSVSARPRPSTISGARHPAIGLHRLLRHVGEQRVGAAEAHHRQLGEEQADVDQDVLRAEQRATASATGVHQSTSPTAAASAACRQRPGHRRCTARRSPGVVKKPIAAATTTISGNGRSRKKMPTKASAASADQQARLQRAAADADQRLDHDHQHRRLDAEQRAVDHRDAAPEHVEQADREHHQRARQHEQDPGREPAAHAVQQPADVGGELLRLRPGQQHAEVERVQVALLLDPLLLVDQDAVHERDLARRPAEAEAADLEPDAERLREAVRGSRAAAPGVQRVVHHHAVLQHLRGHPGSSATGPAKSRAGRLPAARDRAGRCRRRARWSRARRAPDRSRWNLSRKASKLQRSPTCVNSTSGDVVGRRRFLSPQRALLPLRGT